MWFSWWGTPVNPHGNVVTSGHARQANHFECAYEKLENVIPNSPGPTSAWLKVAKPLRISRSVILYLKSRSEVSAPSASSSKILESPKNRKLKTTLSCFYFQNLIFKRPRVRLSMLKVSASERETVLSVTFPCFCWGTVMRNTFGTFNWEKWINSPLNLYSSNQSQFSHFTLSRPWPYIPSSTFPGERERLKIRNMRLGGKKNW